MKKFVLLLCTSASALALPLFADPVALDSTFSELNSALKPVKWTQHKNFSGYLPPAETAVVRGKNGNGNALRIFDTRAQHGACIRTAKRIPGRSGDTVSVTLSARGKGTAWVNLFFYSTIGGWNKTAKPQVFTLTDEWKTHTFHFTIRNGESAETGSYDITFGGHKGLDGEFTEITAEQTEGVYRGNLPFPKHWTIFAPVAPDFVPDAATLNTIPASLGNVRGREELLQANEFDFAPFIGKQAPKQSGWAFAELNAPYECDYTIGAGADWWMCYYVNGKAVIDTIQTGGNRKAVAMNNYTASVRLKKGKNILAVKLITGARSSLLALGGPADLQNMTTTLKMKDVIASDDYEDPERIRSGNPKIIRDHIAPGLLVDTRMGVYSTQEPLAITLPETQYAMPDFRNGLWFGMNARIQNFGTEADSALDFAFEAPKRSFVLRVSSEKLSDRLMCEFITDGRTAKKAAVPRSMLPADFLVCANTEGNVNLTVTSLSNSMSVTIRAESAFFRNDRAPFSAKFLLHGKEKKAAQVTLDNIMTGTAVAENKISSIPFKMDLARSFDPVKAGWKLAFSDEFNGNEVDWSKWYSPGGRNNIALDGKGHLSIKTDYGKDGRNLESGSLWSIPRFLYGYFEARVRFTRQPGWWAAFFLYGDRNTNPMMDGFEIDIFEDYYTRPRKKGDPPGKVLDHNLHVVLDGVYKSWNYNSIIPGSLDDFYTIACKWTPFEISYYMNGKQIAGTATHSTYSTVTFDPFHHSTGVTPLHAILSGGAPRQDGGFCGFKKDGVFPEYYLVDYIRIYSYPQEKAPGAEWKNTDENYFAPVGSTLKFAVNAVPSKTTGKPIKGAYLIDNGYLIDYKTEPPFEFDIPFHAGFYRNTAYTRPGRSGKKVEFNGYPHAFSVFVQDAGGMVAHTPVRLKIPQTGKTSTPYQGKAQTIPGKIRLGHYDEGGQDVAYHDTSKGNATSKTFRTDESVDCSENNIGTVNSGEWINYSVDIASAGRYTAMLDYGTPFGGSNELLLLLDGKKIGKFLLKKHDSENWQIDTRAELKDLELPAGKHLLTLVIRGGYNMGSLEFVQQK